MQKSRHSYYLLPQHAHQQIKLSGVIFGSVLNTRDDIARDSIYRPRNRGNGLFHIIYEDRESSFEGRFDIKIERIFR